MTDYYVINDAITGHRPLVYTHSELIKALNNQDIRWLANSRFDDWLTVYHDASNLHYIPKPYGAELVCTCSSYQTISDTALTRLLNTAHEWYKDAVAHESWDGQTNYLAQSDMLGASVFIPYPLVSPGRYGRHTQHYVSHSTVHYKHGRVGHTMSANGRYALLKKSLAQELSDYPLTHRNRKDRKHNFMMPVFDDDEYTTARRSAGWKTSSKRRHQYRCA